MSSYAAAYEATLKMRNRARRRQMCFAPPPSCLFPVGCVLVFRDEILPVLDPECRCRTTCNLRVHDHGGWDAFLLKCGEVLQKAKKTASGGIPSLKLVTENDLVVLGEGFKNNLGVMRWEDYHSFN